MDLGHVVTGRCEPTGKHESPLRFRITSLHGIHLNGLLDLYF